MTLDEIHNLLSFRVAPEQSCAAVNDLLDKHIDHVARRIREMQALQKQLKGLRSLCHSTQAIKECEILQTLATADGEPQPI